MRLMLFFLLCAAGGCVTSITGFGFALTVMAFLPYVWNDLRFAAAVVGCVSVGMSSIEAIRMRKKIAPRVIVAPAIAYFVISLACTLLAAKRANGLLTDIFACVLVAMSVWYLAFGGKVKIRAGALSGGIAGGLSGLLGALFSTSGPPVAVYMLAACENKEVYRANMQFYFALTSGYIAVVRATQGQITGTVLLYALGGIAFTLAGLWLGLRYFKWVDGKKLRACVCALMGVSGVLLLIQ